jgi:hypothetical protein
MRLGTRVSCITPPPEAEQSRPLSAMAFLLASTRFLGEISAVYLVTDGDGCLKLLDGMVSGELVGLADQRGCMKTGMTCHHYNSGSDYSQSQIQSDLPLCFPISQHICFHRTLFSLVIGKLSPVARRWK